jgi:hypothetical protein
LTRIQTPATAFGTLNDPAYDTAVYGATFNYILSLLYRRKTEIEAQIALIEGCDKEQQQAPPSSPLTNETHYPPQSCLRLAVF